MMIVESGSHATDLDALVLTGPAVALVLATQLGCGILAMNFMTLYRGRAKMSAETVRKSRYSDPVYYVQDNRGGRWGGES